MNKREVIFIEREKGESEKELEIRIHKIIEEESQKGYLLVSMEEKGNGFILAFEGE
jgi:hypothetical protein